MSGKHVVRFEPVGIEIEVSEDQTILRAAAENGVQLMHGCKEGQCSACKSFILEGEDIDHDSYSTFALPDYELAEGMTLLCRAHAYEDLVIELLNYDEEIIRSGLPLRTATAQVSEIDAVTHDLRRLVLQLPPDADLKYFPGQYLDLMVPGTEESRSFSMANPPDRSGRLEFVIKVYPDGLFSSYLEDKLSVGDTLAVEGPYGTFTLRESRSSDLILIAGGAGLAPVLALLRSMADRGVDRKATFYYGVRQARDLCFTQELRALEERLPAFRYVPALSEPQGQEWDGETGLITDVVRRHESSLAGKDAYLCGPPPMVEAALPLLTELGAASSDIFYDKFTTTGEAGSEDVP